MHVQTLLSNSILSFWISLIAKVLVLNWSESLKVLVYLGGVFGFDTTEFIEQGNRDDWPFETIPCRVPPDFDGGVQWRKVDEGNTFKTRCLSRLLFDRCWTT